VHGSLVYIALVVDSNNNFHSVIVDPGNGKVLAFGQIPQQHLLINGGMGNGTTFSGAGSGMGMKVHAIGPHLGMRAGIKHHGIVILSGRP